MKTAKISLENRAKLLDKCPVLAPLSTEDRNALARVMMLQEYEPGEKLFTQDTPAEAFYVITSGKIKIYRTGQDGKLQILHILSPGELVGEVPVFEGANYPATASALNKTSALYIPGSKFLDLAENNPHIMLEMLAILSKRLRRFVEMVDDLSLKEVSARLAKYLLDASVKAKNDVISLEMSKSAIASRLGTIPETLSRTLKKLEKHDIIAVKSQKITILDKQKLIEASAGIKPGL